jgi:hypothetical protein
MQAGLLEWISSIVAAGRGGKPAAPGAYLSLWFGISPTTNSPILVLALLALGALPVLLSIVAIVRIVQRAGSSGWWTLFILVPVVNMAALWYFAFADWPVTRQTRSPQF